MLRGSRKSFKATFKESILDKGKHHWSVERWYDQVSLFLNEFLALEGVTDRDVWASVMLLYPSFGPSEKSDTEPTIFAAL